MVLGRARERGRLASLLESARRGQTGTLVVVGEPGIGKSALLEDACRTSIGMQVLQATGYEAETALPFAGLHALLAPIVELAAELDDHQASSLRSALGLADGEPAAIAVNAATLALLAAAAEKQPTIVVVDDAQWLDQPSALAIAFAARRLQAESLLFLIAVRSGAAHAFDGFETLELGALERDASRALLAQRREQVPSAAVERLLDMASGNPLALLELPLAYVATGVDANATTPARLRRAFAARLELLSPAARRALLLAAAEPDPGAVGRASDLLALDRDALEQAESAGLVVLRAGGVEFRHPLVRALAYALPDPADRRAAHRALAEVLERDGERDRRAWHLAAAATSPDEQLASLLAETADRAATRGGHAAAARAFERAAELSVDPEAQAQHHLKAGRQAFWSGDVERGIAHVDQAARLSADPLVEAEVEFEYASMIATRGTRSDVHRLIAAADAVEASYPELAARLLILLLDRYGERLEIGLSLEAAKRLEPLTEKAGEWWGPRARASVATTYLAAADGERFWQLFEPLLADPAIPANFAGDLIWAERYDDARRALEATLSEGRVAGNLLRVVWNQACLALLDLWQGRLTEARRAAAEAITVGQLAGTPRWVVLAHTALAGVQAWQGDEDGCRRTAAEAIAATQEAGAVVDEFMAQRALGLLSLGFRRFEETIDHLEPAAVRWHTSALVEPSAVPFVPDLIEAYSSLGQRDEAQRWLDRFAAAALRCDRQWALAAVARCEGLLAGSDAFAAPFERSLAILDGSTLALDLARTHLSYGERLRRAGHRREAREHLRRAHAAFARVDAAPWAERAAAELRATGETVGPRTPDRSARLTPQELQIAQLVSEGMTNKQIAGKLFLSPKTIEYHLANAYRKTGVHSRAELTRLLALSTPAE